MSQDFNRVKGGLVPIALIVLAEKMMRKPLVMVVVGSVFGAGCTMGLRPEGSPPRPESVTGISFHVTAAQLGSVGEGLDTKRLAETISKNLGSWGFPLITEPGGTATHAMEASVGTVERAATPVGFSFSPGNSDPRALEFQKADQVTVTCTIRGTEKTHENAYLKEAFVSEGLLDRHGAVHFGFDDAVNKLGTTCFNLLSELRLKRKTVHPMASSSDVTLPSWMPEVRIEVRDKPVAPAVPASAPTGAAKPLTPVKPGETAPAPAPTVETQPETPPAVRTEVKEQETRKQMIIHNQGSPVILEFGYERK